MSSSRRLGASGGLAATVAVFLLLGVTVGIPAAAASGGAATLADDDLLNETVSDTTDTVNSTAEDATERVADTTESTGETVDTIPGDATDGTTDEVSTAVDTAADETAETIDATGTTTDATTDVVSATAAGDLNATTDSVGDVTTGVGSFTADRTTSLVETTATTTATLADSTTGTVTALTGTLDTTASTLGTAVESGPVQELDTGTSGEAATQERAAQLDGATADESAGDGTSAEEGGDDGAADVDGSTDDGAAAAAESGGVLTTLAADSLPVSEDTAMGGLLGGLLLGAAGIAVRQGSMAGGAGVGTTALRTATASAAAGDGPLGRLVRMLAPFRYSRYDDSDPLELDARRDVYEAISDQPGEPITAISDRADVNLSTARHHVKVLRDEGLVATARVRNCERFYPAGTDDLELAAAMADDCTADILDALVRLEPASVSGLADEVDRSPSTVTHHLQKLEDDDIVVRERNGRSVENKLSELARVALDPETERRQHAAERRLDADAEAEAASGAHAD
jgi:DNA-binding transcriptional ArsR family regulator